MPTDHPVPPGDPSPPGCAGSHHEGACLGRSGPDQPLGRFPSVACLQKGRKRQSDGNKTFFFLWAWGMFVFSAM